MGANAYVRDCSGLVPPIHRSLARNAADNIIEIVSPISTGRSMSRDGNAPCVPASKVKCILTGNLEFDGLVVCLLWGD